MSMRRADGMLYVKGALECCCRSARRGDGGRAPQANAEMAARGLRVLAVAVGTARRSGTSSCSAWSGIADPPRTEAIEAVAAARAAGIRTVMITGDHPVTAHAIARELGIAAAGRGRGRSVVHARVTAEDKLAHRARPGSSAARSWR